ncbi:MAG: hypothetical protein AAB481_03475 [Patescibacteria group bacterium]
MNAKRLNSFFPIFVLAIALIVVLWSLMGKGFYISDDGEWMVIRLTAFYQSLADHQFPVRFLGRLNNSYGYPVSNFLYPGFLYIGSLLHFIGFTFVDSVKIILGGSVIGTSVFLFLWLRREFSRFSSTVGVLGFVGAPYLLFDLYKRGSVGEILAFLPAAACMYSIESGKKWLFPVFVAFLIVSHNTLALLFLTVFFILILFRKKFEYIRLLLLGIGLAAFFWMPAIMEKKFVRFDTITVSDPFSYMLTPATFWLVGLPGIIGSALYLFVRKKKNARGFGGIYVCFILGSVILATSLSGVFWTIPVVAALVQFPIRMLAVSTLLGPWAIAWSIERFHSRRIMLAGLFIFIWILWGATIIRAIERVTRNEGYYMTNEGTTTVRDEYMPRWVTSIPGSRSPERLIIRSGRGTIVYEYLNTQRVIAHVEASEESILRLNTIFYPGWGIMIDDRPAKITYQNPNGFIEVSVPAGGHRFIAEFRETVPRFLADMVSIGSFITWIVFVFRHPRPDRGSSLDSRFRGNDN